MKTSKQKITPPHITKLKKNEIMVFGSNLLGNHAGGAARFAVEKFGAINGQGIGLQGKSYAFPTLDAKINKVSLEALKMYVRELQVCSVNNPKLHFLITEVGCGIAGFTKEEIAPIFKDILGIDNFSLPQSFVDVLTAKPIKKGYKVTDKNMMCRNTQFELNKIYHVSGQIIPCHNGIHYCEVLSDCFNYYSFDTSNRVFEIIDHGTTETEGDKSCTSDIELIRELTWLEVLQLCNSGKNNTGRSNSGDSNSGYRNSGNWNSGYRNSGNWNSGNWNSGDRNSGDRNSGDSNSGDSNSGNWNSGYRNSGDRNSGNWNSGDRNSGDSNSGYRNSGAFCTDTNPKLVLFDVQTDILVKDWENHPACEMMYSINPNIWVDESIMSPEEKDKYPTYKTTGGYLKSIPMKEAWNNFWHNLNDSKRAIFTSLPHFDPIKFEKITGIKI